MILPLLSNLGWCTYCYGKDFWNSLVETRKLLDEENQDSEDKTNPFNELSKAFNDISEGQVPLTSVILQLRQTEIIRLLEYQVEWAELVGLRMEEQGLWIYALMSALEKPPHPDVTRYYTTCNFSLTLTKILE